MADLDQIAICQTCTTIYYYSKIHGALPMTRAHLELPQQRTSSLVVRALLPGGVRACGSATDF